MGQHNAIDKLVPIQSVFEEYVHRCQQYYSVSEYITVDEILVGFGGTCGSGSRYQTCLCATVLKCLTYVTQEHHILPT